jgi:DNA-binding NtrC family response regulator
MHATQQKAFTLLLVESSGGEVESFLRTLEEDLPRHEEDQVDIVINATAEGALRRLREQPIDLVVTGVRLPDMTGIQLLDRIIEFDHRIPILVMGYPDTLDGIIEAMCHGAFDYLVKPYDKASATTRLHRAMRMSEILLGAAQAPRPKETRPFNDIVCVSPAMRAVTALIDAVAKVSATALIVGETGTGKELIAKAIHERSEDSAGPFQVVDCTMLAEGTVESELFGHVRGAFTGAVTDKRGLIESGSQGTVFLDEISDVPLTLQAKLLRLLEAGEVRAVGSTHSKKVHTRFISATNQDLAEKVEKGEFRKDLYYRLNVMVIRVPALRDRKEDIPVLARHFIDKYAQVFGKAAPVLHPSAVTELIAHAWPGNVRELRNVMERAVMLSQDHQIDPQLIVGILQGATRDPWVSGDYLSLPYGQAKEKILEEFNHRYISFKLANNQGNITRAATEAGLPRPYFHEIMRRYRRAA